MKTVLMIGPSPHSRGGMASVIRTLLEAGYGQHDGCCFIATQVDGTRARKAGRAAIALAQCMALLATRRVSLLHVHIASGASFWRKAVFIAAARTFACPVLLHVHGGQFREFLEHRLLGWRRRLAERLIAGSHACLVLSHDTAALLRSHGVNGQVDLFPNPIAIAPSLPRSADGSVLFLGRLDVQKGVLDLLRAFALVRPYCQHARLILAGDGDPAPLRLLARQLGLLESVHTPGWIDAATRTGLLASASVFVLPSHNEQMPMSLLEAMAAGVPVIATGVGAISHMLGHGRYGTVVPVGDIDALAASLLKMLQDNILAENFSARGLERVKSEYHVENVLARLRRRYEELLQ